MIQASNTTANLLRQQGNDDWLEPRDDEIVAKGKGVLNTFWVFPGGAEKIGRIGTIALCTEERVLKQGRLEQWIADLLLRRLKEIVARRMTLNKGRAVTESTGRNLDVTTKVGSIPLDEVVEVIALPAFDTNAVSNIDPTTVDIPEAVIMQLRQHVAAVAENYHNNAFHNFEHACHVTMSVDKLLGRIVAPELDYDQMDENYNHGTLASHLHAYTHGINSDPLTLFGMVYAALIHDVDHRGVSNAQFEKEDPETAKRYRHKSVAEQNSLDIAWSHLMSNGLGDLRLYLFDQSTNDLRRFRQVVANTVLATDIFDKELNDLRKTRWSKAFSEEPTPTNHFNDRRATIVIEHLIQASDVSHTMQHWRVYRKWNERLFEEMYLAHEQNRMGADPSSFWYTGELAFFDKYIIPLANKLKECNVFGVSSDECLTYALQNRAEWHERGEAIVEGMVQRLRSRADRKADRTLSI
jgi:3'5'-cyclic nucleotide phosphodiesterase